MKANVLQHEGIEMRVKKENDSTKNPEEQYKAIIFLQYGDQNKFKGLWEELENALLMGEDKYPATITAAYELMSKYKCSTNTDNNNTTKTDGDRTKGTRDPTNAQFAQVTQPNKRGNTPIAGTNGQCYPATECYNCRNTGHIATYCPYPRNSSHF